MGSVSGRLLMIGDKSSEDSFYKLAGTTKGEAKPANEKEAGGLFCSEKTSGRKDRERKMLEESRSEMANLYSSQATICLAAPRRHG